MKSFLCASAALTLALAAPAAWAHAVLRDADPPAGSTLGVAPKQIRLQFNEALEPAFASIRLTGPGNKEVVTGKAAVDKGDGKALVLPLPALAAGAYKARWSVMGHDGHRVKGEVGFAVQPQ